MDAGRREWLPHSGAEQGWSHSGYEDPTGRRCGAKIPLAVQPVKPHGKRHPQLLMDSRHRRHDTEARLSHRGAAQGRYCKLLCKRCALCVSRRRERPQGAAGNASLARRHGGHGGDGHGSVYESAGPAGDRHPAPRGAVDSGYPVLPMYMEPALQGRGRLSAGLDETKDGLKKGIAYDKYYEFSGHPWRSQRR